MKIIPWVNKKASLTPHMYFCSVSFSKVTLPSRPTLGLSLINYKLQAKEREGNCLYERALEAPLGEKS